jgi:hypothetical protein
MNTLRQLKSQREKGKGLELRNLLIRSFLLTFALLLLPFSFAVAGGPGTTTAELLKIPVGARAIGMGQAYTALAEDSSALEWNPAGMAQIEQSEASFLHQSLIENVHYEHAAVVIPGESYAFGTSISYLGYGDIAGYDNSGNSIGNQTADSYVINAGLARQWNQSLSLGVSGSVLRQDLASDSANTAAANIGAIYTLPFHRLDADYKLGFSALNLGPGLEFVSERDPLPRKFKFGGAMTHIMDKPWQITADVTAPNDNSTYISLGTEYWLKNVIALRTGYVGSNDEGKGMRFGIGLRFHHIVFDYAYGSFGDFGATHYFTLSLRFGERVQQLNSEERAILKQANNFKTNKQYVQAILAYNQLLDRHPTNDHILHLLMAANDSMLPKDALQQTSVLADEAIPSPETAALSDLLPGQTKTISKAAETKVQNDPLGLNELPDVDSLDNMLSDARTGTNLQLQIPGTADNHMAVAVSPVATVSNVPVSAGAADLPMLSPSDIYGK